MRAVVLRSHGGPEVLTIEEVDDPTPGRDEIVVDVEHTAINRADILQRMGMYPDPRNQALEIPGLEYAGVVSAVGADVSGWSIGDRAMGIEAGGCYAEKVVTHARQALPVPDGRGVGRCGGDSRGVPHGVGRPRRAGRAHQRALGARARRRVGCRHRRHPDRQGDRCTDRGHLLGREDGCVPRTRRRRRARTQPGRLARRVSPSRCPAVSTSSST